MVREIFNKIINKCLNLKKYSIELNIAEHEDIDFILWCIEDGIKHGHFINIPKEDIEKAITYETISLTKIFIIKFNANPVGIVIENHFSHHHNYCIINHANNQKLYGLEINMLYIIEKFRNKGIGSSVIAHYEQEGHNKILVRCEQNNSKRSIIFFEKLGYKKIGFNNQPKHNMTHIILEKTFKKE